ncbi:MAG: O-antigen ligase family protein [Verrucomicrobiales bacterium]
MNIKAIVLMIAGLFVALWMGQAVGNGDYGTAIAVAGLTVFAVLVSVVGKHYRFEGWAIAIICACYFVGGKGFAYQRLGSLLFIGEAALLLLIGFHLIRCLGGKNDVLPRHPITIPLLIFQIYGFAHLLIDRSYFPFFFLMKDVATIYYGLFFFLVFPPMLHRPTREYLLKLLPVISALALGLLALFLAVPGLEQQVFFATMVRGAPLIMPSIDALIPVCIAFSAFCYFKHLRVSGLWKIVYLFSSVLCTAPLFAQGKAVFYLAFFLFVGALFFVGHWKFFATGLLIGVLSTTLLYSLIESRIIQDTNGRFESFINEFSSFDIAGIGSGKQGFAQENVDWRFTWWKMVIEDVMKENPFYGLGLGSDISTQFHATYFQTGIDNTDVLIARYPHNVLITIMGRLGIIGLMIFIPICVLIVRELWLGMIKLRASSDEHSPGLAFAWAFVLAGFANAFFQSTFEAPYAAIAFWSMLAVLCVMNRQTDEVTEEEEEFIESEDGILSDGKYVMGSRPV